MLENELLTKKEIAQRYKVSTFTIDKWMKKKWIPFIRLTLRCVRFDVAACDQALLRKRK